MKENKEQYNNPKNRRENMIQKEEKSDLVLNLSEQKRNEQNPSPEARSGRNRNHRADLRPQNNQEPQSKQERIG